MNTSAKKEITPTLVAKFDQIGVGHLKAIERVLDVTGFAISFTEADRLAAQFDARTALLPCGATRFSWAASPAAEIQVVLMANYIEQTVRPLAR